MSGQGGFHHGSSAVSLWRRRVGRPAVMCHLPGGACGVEAGEAFENSSSAFGRDTTDGCTAHLRPEHGAQQQDDE